jgi:hypothetical protein
MKATSSLPPPRYLRISSYHCVDAGDLARARVSLPRTARTRPGRRDAHAWEEEESTQKRELRKSPSLSHPRI